MISERRAIKNFIKTEDFMAISNAMEKCIEESVTVGHWLFMYDAIFREPETIHAHTCEFGSELWCPECNPYCHDKHGPNKLNWCGHPKCPMNPKNFKKTPLPSTKPLNKTDT